MSVKITDLGPATLPLVGTEMLELAIDALQSRRISINDLFSTAPGMDGTFVTLTANPTLPNERILTAGAGIAIVDNGAGGTVVISNTASGDVVGPVSSVNLRLALFDGATGKIIQDASTIRAVGNGLLADGTFSLSAPGLVASLFSSGNGGINITGQAVDIGASGFIDAFLRVRNDSGGVRLGLDAGANFEAIQTSSGGAVEDTWILGTRNGRVNLFHDGQTTFETTQFGAALRGIAGSTNSRLEFFDTLSPAATRRFVIGSQGLNQFDIGDDQIDRALRIYVTDSGPTIRNVIIANASGDTLLQGNVGMRLQISSGVISFRTPGIRFEMNSAGQLGLLGNGVQSGVLRITEGTSAFASVATFGQLWVRDDVPNVLVYTDDAGTDFVLGVGSPGGANTNIQFNNAGAFGGSSNFTFDGDRVLILGSQAQLRIDESDGGGEASLFLTSASTGDSGIEIFFNSSTGTDGGIRQRPPGGGPEDSWITFSENAGVTLHFNGLTKLQTQVNGLNVFGSIYMPEQAAASVDILTNGQIWVRNTSDGELIFTDEFGQDMNVTSELWFNAGLKVAANLVGAEVTNIFTILGGGSLKIDEKASAAVDTADQGQLWVLDNTPNELYFTGDTGIDLPVGINAMPPIVLGAGRSVTVQDNGRNLIKTGASLIIMNAPPTVVTGFVDGWMCGFCNLNATANLRLAPLTGTLTHVEPDGTLTNYTFGGSIDFLPGFVGTIWMQSSTQWYVWGSDRFV